MADPVDEEEYHWNARKKKRPLLLYIVLIVLCLLLGWVLGASRHA